MIATLTEVKTILGITTTDKDVHFTGLMPVVQDDIIQYLNNYFLIDVYYDSRTISFSASSILDSANGFISNGLINGNVYVSGTRYNNGLYTVSNVTAGTLTVGETLITESAGDKVRITVVQFPQSLKKAFADMLSWSVNQTQDIYGIKTETLPDGYKIEYDTTLVGYPKSVVSQLNRWRKVRL
jgi:hypothetical protein